MDYSHENSMSINVQKNENIKNKKIIPISENDIKMKKIKFNDLPNLYNENKNMNKNNGNKRQELNNEESKNKNMNDYTQLEINYNKMNKELEELKNENSYIKLKLKEISNIQNNNIKNKTYYRSFRKNDESLIIPNEEIDLNSNKKIKLKKYYTNLNIKNIIDKDNKNENEKKVLTIDKDGLKNEPKKKESKIKNINKSVPKKVLDSKQVKKESKKEYINLE